MFKRFFYQYICLIYSIVQFIFFIGLVSGLIETIAFDQEYGDYTNTISFSIITFVMLFISAIIDKLLRGLKNNNFWIDCLILTIVAPFRLLC